jgi:hypothetical protein
MFGDTITITINSVAKVLNKISEQGNSASYLLRDSATHEYTLDIKHSRDKQMANGFNRERHTVTFVDRTYPLADGTGGMERTQIATLLADRSDVQATYLFGAVGFQAFLTSGNMGKLLNWEV